MEEAARRGEMGTIYKSIRSLKSLYVKMPFLTTKCAPFRRWVSWVGIRHAM